MTFALVKAKLDAYERLIRLDKPVGFLLLMWPTLWGLWMAGFGAPDIRYVFIFVLGTILMRSAGCAVNDWADRDFDGAVKRTAMRPLASMPKTRAGPALVRSTKRCRLSRPALTWSSIIGIRV